MAETELRVEETARLEDAPAPAADEAPPLVQGDPQASIREQIALRAEERRQREIESADERMGIEAAEEAPEPVEEAAEGHEEPSAAPAAEAAPTAHDVAPPAAQQAPQLFPIQLPNSAISYVTVEQLSQLANLGAATSLQQLQRQAQPAPQPPVTPPTPAAPPFDPDDVLRRMNYGSPDEQKQAILDLYNAAARPAIDANAIRQQAVQEALQVMTLNRNLEIIGQEYPDIFASRQLSQLAALQLSDMRQMPQFQNRPDLDLYREACNTVRAALRPVAPPQPAAQTPPASQAAPRPASHSRLERKRAAPSAIVATDRRMSAGDAPRPPTNSEVVSQMRSWRGQPPLN